MIDSESERDEKTVILFCVKKERKRMRKGRKKDSDWRKKYTNSRDRKTEIEQ